MNLIDDGIQYRFLFRHGEDISLSIGAEGKNSVNAAGKQAFHLIAQLLMIHRLLKIVIHRSQDRWNNALNILYSRHMPSLYSTWL